MRRYCLIETKASRKRTTMTTNRKLIDVCLHTSSCARALLIDVNGEEKKNEKERLIVVPIKTMILFSSNPNMSNFRSRSFILLRYCLLHTDTAFSPNILSFYRFSFFLDFIIVLARTYRSVSY
jgi:hypothetical protein